MAMQYWRYNILIELYDLPRDTVIISSEPRNPTGPSLFYSGVHSGSLSWARFDQLIQAGDLVEVQRKVETDAPLKGHAFVYYKISESGKAALEALPNFDKRAARQRAVTI